MKYIVTEKEIPKRIFRIGIGHMGIRSSMKREYTEKEFLHQLAFSLDCGMNYIGTAENHFDGYSEEIIGKTLKNYNRDKIYISTKVSPENLKFKDVITSCENSLKRLKSDYIDLYQVHWPNPDVSPLETFDALNLLKDTGKIKSIGVSNFSYTLINKIMKFSNIHAIEMEYNLVNNSGALNLKQLCEQNNMLYIVYTPLAFPFIEDDNKFKLMQNLSYKYEATISQIILNWITYQSDNIIPIPKSMNFKHISENALSLDFKMEKEDYNLISAVFKTKIEYIPMKDIKVASGGKENRKAYETIEQALTNELNFVPSPKSLANFEDAYDNGYMFPVKVRKTTDRNYKYELYEGRVRYWAHAIHHNGNMNENINCIII